MKKYIIFLLLLSSIFFFYSFLTIFIDSYDSHQNLVIRSINLYTKDRVEKMQFDEYWLLYKVDQKTQKVPEEYLSFLKNRFKENPLKKLINKNDYVKQIRFERNNKDSGGNNFYILRGVSGNIGTSDKILLKALYCDKSGYDDYDFRALLTMKKNEGDYYDTHYLLGLLFLKENKCYDKNVVRKEIQQTASIIAKKEGKDKEFSDLYTERIVVLYWAGFGNNVKKEWIDKIEKSFSKDYGWTDKGRVDFYAHTQGLSLLSLIYFSENKPHQTIF